MFNDLRQSLRTIFRMPGVALVVVLSLGVGIGVNTTVFSWLQLVILQPLPGVAHSGSLMLVEPVTDKGAYAATSWLEYRDLQSRLKSFEHLIAFDLSALTVGDADHRERDHGLFVSGNYFRALGLRPAQGRLLDENDSDSQTVVLSHAYWVSRYAGDPSAIGKTLRANDRELTIVGVAPERFQGTTLGLMFDMFLPATLEPRMLGAANILKDRRERAFSVMGRLASGVGPAAAQTEIDVAMRELSRSYPASNDKIGAEVLPFWRAPRGPQRQFAYALGLLQGAVFLLLLAVCGNTANLMLARASARQREAGVRLALGAGPWRVARLLLTENTMLALAGAALGATLAVWGNAAVRSISVSGAMPIHFNTEVDLGSLAFAIGLGLLCGVMFGLAPALHLSRVDPQAAFRSGFGSTSRRRARSVLMGAEVALALVVLMVSGMFFKSLRETRDIDPGFRREGVMMGAFDFTRRNPDEAQARQFAARLLTKLNQTPGIEAASIAGGVPLDIHGFGLRGFSLEGRPPSSVDSDRAYTNTVTPGYFKALDIAILAGSDFADLSDTAAPRQIIVNQEFVRRFIGKGEALGRRLQSRGRTYTIAGVVRNSLYNSFSETPQPFIYFSYRDRPYENGNITVRTSPGQEAAAGGAIEAAVHSIDPTLPVYDLRTMSEHVEKNLILRKIPGQMFAVLGPLLLLLAAIGIYAVVAYAVSHRTAEIGVRLALGASAGRVIAQIVRESLSGIAVGAAFGWFIALVVALHLNGGKLPLTVFVGIPAILLIVAIVSIWLPARRAAGVDPMVALRHE